MPDSNEGTILVVDDTELVREAVVGILKRANFKVLSADSGAGAIKLVGETHEEIDLLLSDVEMGKMSGPDLGESLKKDRPAMHVMLMSGGQWKSIGSQLRLGLYSEAICSDKAGSNDQRSIEFRESLPARRSPVRHPHGHQVPERRKEQGSRS